MPPRVEEISRGTMLTNADRNPRKENPNMDFTPLSNEQRRQFYDEGYLIVRNAIDSALVGQLLEAGDRMIASKRQRDRQTFNDGIFDSFRNCIAIDDAFLPLLANPRVVPLIVQLFGPRIHLATSHLIYRKTDPADTPRTRRLPGWHRDIANTPEDLGHAHLPRMEMKCAYYLSDLSEPDSGATLISPGSNRLKAPMVVDAKTGDPENVLEPLLKPGDAVFFENRTYHAGAFNRSGRTRKAVMFGYSYMWLRPMDYMVQSPELTNKVDDIGKQLLGGLRDENDNFVPGGIHKPLTDWCEKHGVKYAPEP
jgi:ectoine hydroxylase-related dioxygenase (phytanoyl-CoA dioxygenase family)